MGGQPSRDRRFRQFCRRWHPYKGGFLFRIWRGRVCAVGPAPGGGYWANLDGERLARLFPNGDAALSTLFAAVDRPRAVSPVPT